MGLIDVHAHLLPSIDHTEVTWESLEDLLSLYRACGFDTVCFTPHLYNPFVVTDIKGIRDAFKKAADMSEHHDLLPVLASEVYVSDEAFIKGLPIAGRYILLEFSTAFAPVNLVEKLESVSSELTPIIAHIERYSWLSADSQLVRLFKDKGYLIQINGKAVKKGGRVLDYIESGVVDLVASDCHGNREDIILAAEVISRYSMIQKKMNDLSREIKEVVQCF